MPYKAVVANDGIVQYMEFDVQPPSFKVEFDSALAKWKMIAGPEDLTGLELADDIRDQVDERLIAEGKPRANWGQLRGESRKTLPDFVKPTGR